MALEGRITIGTGVFVASDQPHPRNVRAGLKGDRQVKRALS
jgi:hypothetical protein